MNQEFTRQWVFEEEQNLLDSLTIDIDEIRVNHGDGISLALGGFNTARVMVNFDSNQTRSHVHISLTEKENQK
jgi:hypothetical protein